MDSNAYIISSCIPAKSAFVSSFMGIPFVKDCCVGTPSYHVSGYPPIQGRAC